MKKIKRFIMLLVAIAMMAMVGFVIAACSGDSAQTFTLTYNVPAGATHDNPVTWVEGGDAIELQSASLDGYSFDGWFRAALGGSPITTITPTGDTTLWGRFTRIITDEIAVEEAAAALTWVSFAGSAVIDAVTGNLALPVSGLHGTTISWHSSNPVAISATGAVNRPTADAQVTLTATIARGEAESATVNFIVTVEAAPVVITPASVVFDPANLTLSVATHIFIASILPANANQTVDFSVRGERPMWLIIDSVTSSITILPNAMHEATFIIRAAAIGHPNVYIDRTFTIINPSA